MSNFKRILSGTLATSLALALSACVEEETVEDALVDEDGMVIAQADAAFDLVGVVQGDESFSSFAGALDAAGLAETLSGEGPYTVFAPSDEGFTKLDAAALEQLSADSEAMKTTLLNHVVEGALDIEAMIEAVGEAGEDGYAIATMGGGSLQATLDEDALILTDASGGSAIVTAPDIAASNGLIHAIDNVLVSQ